MPDPTTTKTPYGATNKRRHKEERQQSISAAILKTLEHSHAHVELKHRATKLVKKKKKHERDATLSLHRHAVDRRRRNCLPENLLICTALIAGLDDEYTVCRASACGTGEQRLNCYYCFFFIFKMFSISAIATPATREKKKKQLKLEKDGAWELR